MLPLRPGLPVTVPVQTPANAPGGVTDVTVSADPSGANAADLKNKDDARMSQQNATSDQPKTDEAKPAATTSPDQQTTTKKTTKKNKKSKKDTRT